MTAGKPPRSKPATVRGHLPPTATPSADEEVDDDAFTNLHDAEPTVIDPSVPTGDPRRPAAFDPVARLDAHRRAPHGAPVDPREVIARVTTPPPVAAASQVGPRDAARFDPHGRIDDSSRTKKWDPAVPAPRPGSEPIRTVSMKTPIDAERDRHARALPMVQLRPMADVRQTPANGLGRLAPPHDPAESRTRRVHEYVIWSGLAVIVACGVMLAVWFLAR